MKYGLSYEAIAKITTVLQHHREIEQAIIFGSRALPRNSPSSDIDLTLKGRQLNTTIVNALATELDDLLLPVTFDLFIYDHISNNDLIDHINRAGQIFYQKRSL